MDQTGIIVIGAGAVGLAVAAELTKRFPEESIILLERHSKFGQDTSSRNSEVMHAGMYYPSGSLKAKMCVEGNPMLYEFCQNYGIPHQRIGKLIIARNEAEIPNIQTVIEQGKTNGILDLQWLDAEQVSQLEPNITAAAAVFSPSTGIIDSHKLMLQLERLAQQGNAMLAYKHKVVGINHVENGYEVLYEDPEGEQDSLMCQWLVNCAGLYADQIAAFLGIDVEAAGYKICPVKGEYFSINSKSNLISHLVYPPPLKALKGLGTHVTKSLDGRARLGPNVVNSEDREDYDVDESHAEEFYQAAKTYLPFLEYSDLQPDMAGMRPKIQAPDGGVADFVICHETERGLEGFINLVGIESPGLTSCLSIAKMVGDMINKK
jgi:L-2-hydroxyglutarate oxidase LhgO